MATRLDTLKARAARFGVDSLETTEAVELLIGRAGAANGANLARALVERFQTLPDILGASLADLAAIVGAKVAAEIRLVHGIQVRAACEPFRKRCVITSWTALMDYVRVQLGAESREQFRVLFLDKKNQLIADEMLGAGTVDHAPVYPREVVRRALELGASALILVHNHPSGDPTPSQADIDMTRQVIEAARALKITIHDHLVVGADGCASFKALGLI